MVKRLIVLGTERLVPVASAQGLLDNRRCLTKMRRLLERLLGS